MTPSPDQLVVNGYKVNGNANPAKDLGYAAAVGFR